MELSGTGVWSGQLRYGDAGRDRRGGGRARRARLRRDLDPRRRRRRARLGRDAARRDAAHRRSRPASSTSGCTNRPRSRRGARRGATTWQRRFLLGLGVSHAPLIDHGNPGRYTKPYSKMVEYLDGLDAADVPFPADARVLAALRPRMLGLARDRTAGVHPYFVPPEHVARAREIARPRRDDRGRARGRARHRSVDRARNRAPAHRGLREPAELHEQPARVRLRRRRLRRPRAATGWSTRSSRGATSTRSPRGCRRCATPAPTMCASR